MSTRYRISMSYHRFDLDLPDGEHVAFCGSLSQAINAVARLEAYRLAGDDWTITPVADAWMPKIVLTRFSAEYYAAPESHFWSWEQVALFLQGWHARRALLMVSA